MDKASLHDAHEAVTEVLGPPAILVNAAGGNDPKVTVTAERPIEAITIEDWRANFDMNVVGGVLLPSQEFGPAMCERGRGALSTSRARARASRCRASWPTRRARQRC